MTAATSLVDVKCRSLRVAGDVLFDGVDAITLHGPLTVQGQLTIDDTNELSQLAPVFFKRPNSTLAIRVPVTNNDGRNRTIFIPEVPSVLTQKFAVMCDSAPPTANSAAEGYVGDISMDANFFYVCVATNQWKRIALSAY